MKAKNLALMSASILALVLFIGLTSAASLTIQDQVIPSSVTNTAGTFDITFDLVNSGVEADIDWNGSTITGGNADISFSEDYINASETLNIVATVTFDTSYTGTISGTIEANPSGAGDSKTLNFSVQINDPVPDWQNNFCEWDDGITGNPGDLRVKIEDITVTGFGDDKEWLPFDEIEVEVSVDNRGNDDVDNIEIEWGLYDEEQEEWVIDVDNEKDFDLKDGDDETITFTFKIDNKMDIDLEDLDDGTHYTLYVRATGEVDNDDNDDTCSDDQESIELVYERDFVILTNIDVSSPVSCGSNLEISADVWNIGTRDQDNVQVKVFNNKLGIDEMIDVGDINSFSDEKLSLSIEIPEDAEEDTYVLSFEVYDEDDDLYVNDYDDQDSRFTLGITVQGSCSDSPIGGSDSKAIVSAKLEAGGKAGEELVIRATLTNTGNQVATYLINAAGYAEWASLEDIEPNSITLDSLESGDIVLTFTVKDDAEGDKLFDLEVVSGSELVVSQPVSVSITPKAKTDLSGIFGDNWYLWLIGVLNVILVIIIIIVAIKVARK